MLAHAYAPALFGIDGRLVSIECDITNGLPGFVVVGLGDKAVDEARERVRSAIKNSGLLLPPKRVTLNLAPADLPKDGSGYDLGMAVAILAASGQIDRSILDGSLFLGELAPASPRTVHSNASSYPLATRLKQAFSAPPKSSPLEAYSSSTVISLAANCSRPPIQLSQQLQTLSQPRAHIRPGAGQTRRRDCLRRRSQPAALRATRHRQNPPRKSHHEYPARAHK